MDLTPRPGSRLTNGAYQCFPCAASHDDVVLGVWRSSASHQSTATGGTKCMGAISRDGGDTWTSPKVVFEDTEALADHAPAGLAWDARQNRWLMQALKVKFSSSTDTKPSSYAATMLASSDGMSWTVLREVSLDGLGWYFASGLSVGDQGEWLLYGYGALSGSSLTQPLVLSSSDGGASWAAPVAVQMPAGVSGYEPQVTRTSHGWIMLVRGDDNQIHQARSTDGHAWAYEKVIAAGVSGMPSVTATTNGDLVAVMRDLSDAADGVHGTFLYATSGDDGASWQVRSDFPDQTRAMMYAGLAPTASGGVACVYGVEDDPAKPWASASVYTMRFLRIPLFISQDFDGAVPFVRLGLTLSGKVMRHAIDPATGEVSVDEVRCKVATIGGSSYDYEVQQGQRVWYSVGERVSRTIEGPILQGTLLVHPTRPELSLRVDIITDDSRDYPIDSTVQPVPASASSDPLVQFPIVTTTGYLGGAQGSTKVRTRTLADKRRLLRLMSDLHPLFWSHHPGLDMPDWVRVTGLSEDRFLDQCTSPMASWEDDTDKTQWRTWSLKWVAQARPSTAGLPLMRRIRDVQAPIRDIQIGYEDF